jgi:hypothetical protein
MWYVAFACMSSVLPIRCAFVRVDSGTKATRHSPIPAPRPLDTPRPHIYKSCWLCLRFASSTEYSWFLFGITQYIGETRNARTLIPMDTRTQTLLLGASSKTADKSSRLTKSPPTSRYRRERRLPLKAQTPLNPEKFAPTRSRTHDLRCYRGSCNH